MKSNEEILLGHLGFSICRRLSMASPRITNAVQLRRVSLYHVLHRRNSTNQIMRSIQEPLFLKAVQRSRSSGVTLI